MIVVVNLRSYSGFYFIGVSYCCVPFYSSIFWKFNYALYIIYIYGMTSYPRCSKNNFATYDKSLTISRKLRLQHKISVFCFIFHHFWAQYGHQLHLMQFDLIFCLIKYARLKKFYSLLVHFEYTLVTFCLERVHYSV